MLSRIDEKRDDICNALTLTNGKQYRIINDIDLEAGDTHNNGRSVAIIHTDAGKIVYKPHDMRGDEQIYMLAKKFFNEFVGIPKSIASGTNSGSVSSSRNVRQMVMKRLNVSGIHWVG